MDWSYSAAGALTGFVVGMTGVGGGALMTPLLLLVFGVAPITAIATDLWFATITKLVGALFHHKAGQVDWQVVKRLWLGSLPMALVVVLWVAFVSGVEKLDWLNTVIGLVILVTAIGLVFSTPLQRLARSRRLGKPMQFKHLQPILTVAGGAVLGLAVALTSVGAGALGAAMLLYIYPLRMTPHKLVGTDLVHAIPLAAVAGIGYLLAGLVDFQMLMRLLIGSIPGVLIGTYVGQQMDPKWLKLALGGVLALISFILLAN
jgi:uncharacterized protein